MLVIEAKDGGMMTKQHGPDGTVSYDKTKWFKMTNMGISSFSSMCRLLKSLEDEPSKCIVRGSGNVSDGFTNRRAYVMNGGVLELVPTRWLLFDFDGEGDEWVEWVQRGLADPAGTVDEFLARDEVPDELRNADIYWQYGASFGVGAANKFSLHLWVWTDEEVLDPRAYYKRYGFDSALAAGTQPHYTARPIFRGGLNDPMPVRSGVRVAAGDMDVSEVLECQAHDVTLGGDGCSYTVPSMSNEELISEYNSIDVGAGGRHEAVRGWSAKAVANGIDVGQVSNMCEEKLVELGKDRSVARVDGRNLAVGAARKGISVDGDPAVVFSSDDQSVELAEGEVSDVCGPTLMEMVDSAEEGSVLGVLSDNMEKLVALSESDAIRLEEKLWDLGVIADKRGRGVITPAKFDKMRRGGDGSGGELDAREVARYKDMWKGTYVSEDLKHYFFYNEDEGVLREVSKKDELDGACAYMCAKMKPWERVLFKEKFYKDIHEKRMIARWRSEVLPFGKSETKLEPRRDGKVNVIVITSLLQHLELLARRSEVVEVPVEFERWMESCYGEVWDVLDAVLARRFLGNKRSTIWVNCVSNWGKTFFFSLKEYARCMNNSYKADDFRGDDPSELSQFLYIFVDEADRFTSDMKLDTMPYRRLYGGQMQVTLPARVIASANPIGDLSDGVDAQLLNRVVKVETGRKELAQELEVMGWSTQKARGWYEALVARRMFGLLSQWVGEDDFTSVVDGVYSDFCSKYAMEGEDIEEAIRLDFWETYLWLIFAKRGDKFNFVDSAASEFFWIDNGSDDEPLRRRIYLRRPVTWFDGYAKRSFGPKYFAVKKSCPNVDSLVRVLGGVKCSKLPNQKSFRGMWFDVSKVQVRNTLREVKCE